MNNPSNNNSALMNAIQNTQTNFENDSPVTDKSMVKYVQHVKETVLDKYINNNPPQSESFAESFPNYGDDKKGIFASLKHLFKQINESKEFNKLIEKNKEKSLSDLIAENLKKSDDSTNTNPFNTLESLTSWKERPFGHFGDSSLNSIVSNIIKKDYTYVNDIINISVKPLSLIPAGLTYTTLVRLYLNKMNQDNSINFMKTAEEKLRFLNKRNREINIVTFLIAPIVTLTLVSVFNHSILDSFNISLNNNNNLPYFTDQLNESSVVNSSSSSSSSSSSIEKIKQFGFFFFSSKKIYNNSSNWLKKIMTIILLLSLLIGLLIYLIGLKSVLVLIFNIKLTYVKLFIILLLFYLLLYKIFEIFLYFLFSKNDITIPDYFPNSVKYNLDTIKLLSKSEGFWSIIKLLFIDLCILIVTLFMMLYFYF